jgi:hypothetical protein
MKNFDAPESPIADGKSLLDGESLQFAQFIFLVGIHQIMKDYVAPADLDRALHKLVLIPGLANFRN